MNLYLLRLLRLFITRFVYLRPLVNYIYRIYLCKREDTDRAEIYSAEEYYTCLTARALHYKLH